MNVATSGRPDRSLLRPRLRVLAGAWLAVLMGPAALPAQNSSLSPGDMPAVENVPAPVPLPQGSWTYIAPPPPQKIQIHDVVVVRVDEMARMQSDGEMDRRKNATYDAVLKDWVFLQGLKAVRPSPQSDGDPRLRGQLQQLYRAEAEMQTRESLALNIACSIGDILPNGNLVLEGHKQIRVNEEVWEVSLSGICRREDIGADGIVLSKNVVDLRLDKRERGHVRDGYVRGWFLRWFDRFQPF